MRLFSGVLACVFIGAGSVALAEDPPPSATDNSASTAPAAAAPSAAPATTAATPAPVASATKSAVTVTAAATPPAAPEVDPIEKHFISEGYRMQMRNGEKVFCRREEVMGTRLGSNNMTCSTAEVLKQTEAQAHATVERAQNQQASGPTGR